MASVTLWTQFGRYSFDADLESQGKMGVTLPSYPTESGVRINEHRVLLPNELKIRGITSTMPMGVYNLETIISRISSHSSLRPSTFLESLVYLLTNGLPFTVSTRYMTYENMMISEIIPIHTAEQDHSLTIDLKLQEFMTVDKLVATGVPIVSQLHDNDPSRSAISAGVQSGELPTARTSAYFGGLANVALNAL